MLQLSANTEMQYEINFFYQKKLYLNKLEQIQCNIAHLHGGELIKRAHLYTLYKYFETFFFFNAW